MASIQDLNALMNGQPVVSNTGMNSAGQQVVVLNNGMGTNSCIPCDTQACPTIVQTQTSGLDIGGIQGTTPSCIQWDVVNTSGAARYLTIGGPENEGELPIYALASAKYFSAATNAFGSAAFTTNGNAHALDVQYNNTLIGDAGAVVCTVELNINTNDTTFTGNTSLSNNPITVLSIPSNPQDGTCGKIDYAPFCSACVTTNNDGFVTKLFSITAPIGIRSAVAILFPGGSGDPVTGGSAATVRVCYAYIGIQNHALADASTQF